MTTSTSTLTPEQEQRALKYALEEQTYSIAFEMFLDEIAGGAPLERAIREYHADISPTKFRAWVYADPKRRQAYMVAKALGAEAVEDELIRIADGLDPEGNPTPVDVARSTLMITTRKWLLGVWNRKRYGDVKHIEQTNTTTIDVTNMTTDELKRLVMKEMGQDPSSSSTVFDNDGFAL